MHKKAFYLFHRRPLCRIPTLKRSLTTAARRKNLYTILGVSPSSTEKEIKDAYFALSKKFHPDMNPKDDNAAQKFLEVGEAYEVLSSPDAKRTYDLELGIGRTTPPAGGTVIYGEENDGPMPRYGVRPEWGRPVDVDLSEERMKRAWEAYKKRWAEEEEARIELEKKKLEFRRKLDEKRATMDTMTLEEREIFRARMRQFLDPLKDHAEAPRSNRSDQDSRRESSWQGRSENNFDIHTEDRQKKDHEHASVDPEKQAYEDPLMSSRRKQEGRGQIFSEWGKNMRTKMDNVRENYNNSHFVGDSPEYSARYGVSKTRETLYSRLFFAGILALVIGLTVIDNNYKTDASETNVYLQSLKKQNEKRKAVVHDVSSEMNTGSEK